ncbi:hypothetical protein [Haloechinothrix sp. LS1_15]|uniref:hypothetical protein n=1 Tax=Haloechinothrix sp. LS1_15 TaxID=2652248 RepID=UPI002944223B|nr:hypothetical protein [Haloechinothrix sp. LS1_15]MDV6013635.1 hypothetical protein [Haloechinothrix sp. LS1_15]
MTETVSDLSRLRSSVKEQAEDALATSACLGRSSLAGADLPGGCFQQADERDRRGYRAVLPMIATHQEVWG